jgi:hypothetical protein
MILYRGDFVHNTLTTPGRFRFDGITAKSFGKGAPKYIEKNGLLKTMQQHIAPKTIEDKAYYNVTDFLSFSTNFTRAEYWATNKNTLILNSCVEDYSETRYLFSLTINDNELLPISTVGGMYIFNYQCNPNLKKGNSPNPIETAIIRRDSCEVCNLNGKFHSLLLIDSVKYLTQFPNAQNCEDALSFAKTDEEWLILPNDPMRNGRSSRIHRADFWHVELFNVVGEHRDPYEFQMLGQIL